MQTTDLRYASVSKSFQAVLDQLVERLGSNCQGSGFASSCRVLYCPQLIRLEVISGMTYQHCMGEALILAIPWAAVL